MIFIIGISTNLYSQSYTCVKDWTLTDNQYCGSTTLWYTIYVSNVPIRGYYNYILYFQSASTYDNCNCASVSFNDLVIYQGTEVVARIDWGIIGCTENGRQSFTIESVQRLIPINFKFSKLTLY